MATNYANYQKLLPRALAEGKQRHPAACAEMHAAFANAVATALTGISGGYGGPSIREYSCVERLEEFDAACTAFDARCYGPITTAHLVAVDRPSFDDAPGDVEALVALQRRQ